MAGGERLGNIRDGNWSISIPKKFNSLCRLAKNWQDKLLCSLKLPEEEKITRIKSNIEKTGEAIETRKGNVILFKRRITDNDAHLQDTLRYSWIKYGTVEQSKEDLKKEEEKISDHEKQLVLFKNKLDKHNIIKLTFQPKNLSKNLHEINILDNLADNGNDANEVQLSIYIQALLMTCVSKNMLEAEELPPSHITLYQYYIIALGNFFNWYLSENGTYNKLFEKFTRKLLDQDNEYYKNSYIAIVCDGLSFYKQDTDPRHADEFLFAEKQICALLELFKDDASFKDIYQKNFKAIENENDNPLDDNQISQENNQDNQNNEGDGSGANKSLTMARCLKITILCGIGFLLLYVMTKKRQFNNF